MGGAAAATGAKSRARDQQQRTNTLAQQYTLVCAVGKRREGSGAHSESCIERCSRRRVEILSCQLAANARAVQAREGGAHAP